MGRLFLWLITYATLCSIHHGFGHRIKGFVVSSQFVDEDLVKKLLWATAWRDLKKSQK